MLDNQHDNHEAFKNKINNMTCHRLLLRLRVSRSLLSLLAILLVAVVVCILIWLWFDYRMKQLEDGQKQPIMEENPNF